MGAWTLVVALLVLRTPSGSLADPANLRNLLHRELSRLPHDKARVGACVVDLSTGQTVFELNADHPLIPASNAKLLVMAAVLVELGPDFEFRTRLGFDGTHLYLIGDGDPAFVDEKINRSRGWSRAAPLDEWADRVRSLGHTVIPGDLVYDASLFDDQTVHPAWEPADLGKWYAAPVSGLNINDNCLDFTVEPTRPGAKADIEVFPRTALVSIVNACRTGSKGEPILHHPPGTHEYRITGGCRRRWSLPPVAFPEPARLAADALRMHLSARQVVIRGELRTGSTRDPAGRLSEDVEVLAEHVTPIADVLRRAGKDSQNLFAECLFKRLGYDWTRSRGWDNPVGSWVHGGRAVVDVLARAGVSTEGMAVSDGSGLSRANRCTARQLAHLLVWMDARPTGELFRESLAEAGSDGSLRKRLQDLRTPVFAKTGTMRGVRALSGYVLSPGGSRYAFSIMFNDYPGSSAPYKDIQDRVCRILARSQPPGIP